MAFIALAVLLAQNLGLGRTYPWTLLPYDLGRWIWLALSLGLVALLAEQAGLIRLGRPWQRAAGAIERAMGHRLALIGLLAGNAVFAGVSYFHFAALGYGFPWLHLVVVVAAIPFVRPDRFWLSCGVNLALLAASIVHFPLVAARSEFLPGIQEALNALALGGDPYGPGSSPMGAALLPGQPGAGVHLPGVLLAHVPAWVLGLDLRWGQAVWRLAWMLVIGTAPSLHRPGSPWRTLAHVFVLNPYYNFRHDLYFEGFLFLVAAYHAWPGWRWLFLPALVWTRQWAWVMAPFLALDWLVNRSPESASAPPAPRLRLFAPRASARLWRRGARQAGWLALGAGLVTAALALALWHSTPPSRWITLAFSLAAPADLFDYGLTLAPLAPKLGATFILQPLQAGLAALLGLWTLWRWWSRRDGSAGRAKLDIERMGLVALCASVLLNPFYETYFWLDAGFWILAAYALRAPVAGSSRHRSD